MERMEDMTNVKSLYSPKFEHDNCGIGAVVNIKGKKSHDTVANALTIVETLEHRAGTVSYTHLTLPTILLV